MNVATNQTTALTYRFSRQASFVLGHITPATTAPNNPQNTTASINPIVNHLLPLSYQTMAAS